MVAWNFQPQVRQYREVTPVHNSPDFYDWLEPPPASSGVLKVEDKRVFGPYLPFDKVEKFRRKA